MKLAEQVRNDKDALDLMKRLSKEKEVDKKILMKEDQLVWIN